MKLNGLDKIQAAEELIKDTLSYCENGGKGEKRKYKFSVSSLAASAAIIAVAGTALTFTAVKNNSFVKEADTSAVSPLSSVEIQAGSPQITGEDETVLPAGDEYSAQDKEETVEFPHLWEDGHPYNSAASLNYLSGVTDMNGNNYIFGGMTDINQTAEAGKLEITLNSYYAEKEKLILDLDVRTIDGSSMYSVEDGVYEIGKTPAIQRDGFENIALLINGEQMSFTGLTVNKSGERTGNALMAWRVDDGSEASYANIQITVEQYEKDLSGALINLQLTNYLAGYLGEKDYETKVFSEGTWAYEFTVEKCSQDLDYNPEVEVQDTYFADRALYVKEIHLTSTELIIDGMAELGTGLLSVSGERSPVITMKDGTVISAGNKCEASANDYEYEQHYSWELFNLLDVDEVQSITWHGALLYYAQ